MNEESLSKQITNLRKSGKLNEAYQLGLESIKQNPEDIWIERAFSWTLYEFLKQNKNNIYQYTRTLEEIGSHDFDFTEHGMLFENIVKNIRFLGWELIKQNRVKELYTLFLGVSNLFGDKDFFEASTILQMFLRDFEKDKPKLIQLVDWFGFKRFSYGDYHEKVYEGKTQPSLVEKTINEYLKALVQKNSDGSLLGVEEQIEFAISQAKTLLEKYDYKWTPYQLSKLFIEIGRLEEGKEIFLPFAQKNSKQAYIWDHLAEFYKGISNDLYYACIFKALTLPNKIEFTLNLRRKALEYFVNISEDYPAAKYEIQLIHNCKAEHGWGLDEFVAEQTQQLWFGQTIASKSNASIYQKLSQKAEDLLYGDLTPEDFYVEWKSEEKNLIGIATSEKRMTLKDKNVVKELQVGKIYCAKFITQGIPRMIGEYTVSENEGFKQRYVREINGVFERVKEFGFIRDGFIEAFVKPDMVLEYQLENLWEVRGILYRKYNSRKNRWLWEMGEILGTEKPQRENYKREFSGEIEVTRSGFGFVEGCFVPADLVSKYDVDDFDIVKVKAEKSWDRKKKQWSWKAIEIL